METTRRHLRHAARRRRLPGRLACLACLICLALAVGVAPARATGATVVADINTHGVGTRFGALVAVGETLFFIREGRTPELWRSDGTPGGTTLVTAIEVGQDPYGSIEAELIGGSERLFFVLGRGAQPGLWTSDGTAAGTVRLLTADPAAPIDGHALVGRTLFFSAVDAGGRELWASDGTATGTRRVADLRPGPEGSGPHELTAAGARLFFVADDGVAGRELWASDGTAAGTTRLPEFQPGPESADLSALTAVGDQVFGVFADRSGPILWATTAGGTGVRQLAAWCGMAGLAVDQLTGAGDRLFLRVAHTGPTGAEGELWLSDGSPAGTRRVRAFGTAPEQLTAVGSRLFFSLVEPATGSELWTSDGSEAGTTLVREILPGEWGANPLELTAVGGRLYFVATLQPAYLRTREMALFQSDGSTGGTVALRSFIARDGPESETPADLAAVGARLFFVAGDRDAGRELWRSDGTPRGTVMVKDITAGTHGSGVSGVIRAGQRLYLIADDGTHGPTLWSGDLAGSGLRPVIENLPFVPGLSTIAGPWALGERALFAIGGTSGYEGLWSTDGTRAGTHVLSRGFANLLSRARPRAVVGRRMMFLSTAPAGEELWSTDGTPEGTTRIAGLGSAAASELTAVGATLFFTAQHADGVRLWRSDGSEAGTGWLSVRPIAPGWAGPQQLTAVGGRLFFVAASPQSGAELWVSDGTSGGTRLVRDINTGPASAQPRWLTASGGTLFFAADDGRQGCALWRSDGSAEGTALVHDMFTGQDGAGGAQCPGPMVMAGGRLFLSAVDAEHGRELWTSDGTAQGTRMVGDLRPGPLSSYPDDMTAIFGRILFSAGDGAGGPELWLSDGSTGGTRQLLDLWPGPDGSYPSSVRRVGERIFFGADDGLHGRELVVLPVEELGLNLRATSLPLIR